MVHFVDAIAEMLRLNVLHPLLQLLQSCMGAPDEVSVCEDCCNALSNLLRFGRQQVLIILLIWL